MIDRDKMVKQVASILEGAGINSASSHLAAASFIEGMLLEHLGWKPPSSTPMKVILTDAISREGRIMIEIRNGAENLPDINDIFSSFVKEIKRNEKYFHYIGKRPGHLGYTLHTWKYKEPRPEALSTLSSKGKRQEMLEYLRERLGSDEAVENYLRGHSKPSL